MRKTASTLNIMVSTVKESNGMYDYGMFIITYKIGTLTRHQVAHDIAGLSDGLERIRERHPMRSIVVAETAKAKLAMCNQLAATTCSGGVCTVDWKPSKN